MVIVAVRCSVSVLRPIHVFHSFHIILNTFFFVAEKLINEVAYVETMACLQVRMKQEDWGLKEAGDCRQVNTYYRITGKYILQATTKAL